MKWAIFPTFWSSHQDALLNKKVPSTPTHDSASSVAPSTDVNIHHEVVAQYKELIISQVTKSQSN